MRSQPRVLIAVSLLAAIVPWDLERLECDRPVAGVLWDRRSDIRRFARSAMTTTAD